MTTLTAYADLLLMGKPVVTTQEAVIRLGLSVSSATQALTRLQHAGLARRIFRGLWTLDRKLDPLLVPEYLTAPFPAYISFQSALFFHGMISQVPQVTYVASLGPTRRVRTSIGVYSIHRLAPTFFGGYRTEPESGVHLAGSEKALMDVFYLSSVRSRLFASLPEVTLSPQFDVAEAKRWIERIGDPSRKSLVQERLAKILGRRRRSAR